MAQSELELVPGDKQRNDSEKPAKATTREGAAEKISSRKKWGAEKYSAVSSNRASGGLGASLTVSPIEVSREPVATEVSPEK